MNGLADLILLIPTILGNEHQIVADAIDADRAWLLNLTGPDASDPTISRIADALTEGANFIRMKGDAPLSEYAREVTIRDLKADVLWAKDNLSLMMQVDPLGAPLHQLVVLRMDRLVGRALRLLEG